MKYIRPLLGALVLLATGGHAAAAPCFDVAASTPAAIPDDGMDDRAGIQATIATALAAGGGSICFHGGTYDIQSKASGSNASFNLGNPGGGMPAVPAANLAFVGEGPATVLKLSSMAPGSPWHMFELSNGAHHIQLRDLTLDGSGAPMGNAGKLIQLGTGDAVGVSHVSIDNVTFAGAQTDAIQILGASTGPNVSYISIRGSRFASNGGRGVVVLQGAQGVSIQASVFDGNTGHDLASSYSSAGSWATTPTTGLEIAGNTFRRTGAAVPIALSLVGYDLGTSSYKDLTVTGNVLVDARISMRGFDRALIANNTVIGGAQATADSELYVSGRAEDLTIEGNLLIRTSATAGNVIGMQHVGSVAPRRVALRGNQIIQASATNAVQLYSVSPVTVAGNYITFTNASTGVYYGIGVRAISNAIDGVAINGNTIAGDGGAGSFGAAIQLTPSSYEIKNIAISSNTARGTSYGIKFDTGIAYTTTPLVAGNTFNASTGEILGLATTCTPSCNGIQALAIGGNIGGVVKLTGNGAPTMTAPTGSWYLRRDGAASTTLYIREGGTWSAK